MQFSIAVFNFYFNQNNTVPWVVEKTKQDANYWWSIQYYAAFEFKFQHHGLKSKESWRYNFIGVYIYTWIINHMIMKAISNSFNFMFKLYNLVNSITAGIIVIRCTGDLTVGTIISYVALFVQILLYIRQLDLFHFSFVLKIYIWYMCNN